MPPLRRVSGRLCRGACSNSARVPGQCARWRHVKPGTARRSTTVAVSVRRRGACRGGVLRAFFDQPIVRARARARLRSAGHSPVRCLCRRSAAQQLTNDVLQDAAVDVVNELLRGVQANERFELASFAGLIACAHRNATAVLETVLYLLREADDVERLGTGQPERVGILAILEL